MILNEYKDISRIYKEKNFKRQIIIRCIFHIILILFFPLMDYISVNYLVSRMIFSLLIIIGFGLLGVLEKKELFIPREYFHKYKYRGFYVVIFILLWIFVSNMKLGLYRMCLYSIFIAPIEIFACYKEYTLFNDKMKELNK